MPKKKVSKSCRPTKTETCRVYRLKSWIEEGERFFGKDRLKWRFVCPSCGHVATVEEYRKAGAPEGAVGFSCIGRFAHGKIRRGAFDNGKGPCDYAGGGLIRYNPVKILPDDGDEPIGNYFDFDRSGEEKCQKKK